MKGAETAGDGPLQAAGDRAAEAFAATRAARDKARALRRPPPQVSTIEKDAEVGAFLRERFKSRMSGAELRAACAERFGEGRTPSVGRINVFRERVRMQWRTK